MSPEHTAPAKRLIGPTTWIAALALFSLVLVVLRATQLVGWPWAVAPVCVASYDEAHHDMTKRYLDGAIAQLLSNREIIKMLES